MVRWGGEERSSVYNGVFPWQPEPIAASLRAKQASVSYEIDSWSPVPPILVSETPGIPNNLDHGNLRL